MILHEQPQQEIFAEMDSPAVPNYLLLLAAITQPIPENIFKNHLKLGNVTYMKNYQTVLSE